MSENSHFEREIIAWFKKNKRDLPWRKTDAWGVLVSEIMLQQTPVQRVLPVYNEWMKRWPTPAHLAKATPAEIITAWGRLGYPRRALRLHECAKVITTELNGAIPTSESELRKLPGIGEYTAAAMVAFAFEGRSLVLDINIRRLFSRLYRGEEAPTAAPTKVERVEYAEYVPGKNAHIWAAATMELGALICTAKNPLCGRCPVADQCKWRSLDYPASERVKRTQTWHGTDRQCRGTLVQALRENSTLNKKQLHLLWDVPSQVEKAILTLLDDGLIEERRKNTYSLPR
jgi:A/G-specific adenine glycosylase